MSDARQSQGEARAREERESAIDSAMTAASLVMHIGRYDAYDACVMVADDGELRPVTDWRGEVHENRKTLTLYLGGTRAEYRSGDYGKWDAAENIVRAVTRVLENRSPAEATDTFRSALAGLGPGERRVVMNTKTTYVAQYIPRGGHAFADLRAEDSEPGADAAIEGNILGWQAHEHLHQGIPSGRPQEYRVIKRTVTEEVLSERLDDGAPLQGR